MPADGALPPNLVHIFIDWKFVSTAGIAAPLEQRVRQNFLNWSAILLPTQINQVRSYVWNNRHF